MRIEGVYISNMFKNWNIKSLYFIIAIQVFYLFIVFAFFKEGYHSDEIYNYGFANSYYIKDLNNYDAEDSYFNNWNNSQIFKDYISVDKDHRFANKSVIQNCNLDFNPPFQFLVLHTICSFFPGVFSWYFCFILNIISFVVSQIFIYKLSKSISKNEIIGLCSVILYGFCVGAMDIAIFLRIYALGIMFLTIFMYYSHKIYSNNHSIKRELVINLIVCFAALFFGSYTMHVFLIPAFSITLCYCLYYLFSKRIKLVFIYGFTCLFSVILSCLAYPKVFSNLGINILESDIINTSSTSYSLIKYPFSMQLRLYAFQFTRDLFGIHVSPLPNPYLEWFLIGLACLVILLLPICFIFRKEEWFKKFLISLKNRFIEIFKKIRYFNFSIIVLFVSSLLVWVIAAWKTSWYLMNICANRYIFVGYPLAAVCGVVSIYYLIKLLFNKRLLATAILIILSCLLSVSSHFMSQSHAYLFEHETDGLTLDKLEEDSNCVIMLDNSWTIVLFAPKLYKTNNFNVTTIGSYKSHTYFDNVDKTQPYYVILNLTYLLDEELDEDNLDDHNLLMMAGNTAKYYTLESDVVSFFESENNVDYLEYVGMDEIMKRQYHIFKVHFK